ncbi:MAG: glycosyltransferase [Pirellulaceae bacterium]
MRIILVLTDPPLPFGNAASTRWFYVLVRELVRRGFDLTVLAAAARPDDIETCRTLFPESQYDVRYFLPDQRRRLMDRVHSVARPFDYVYSKAMRCELQQQIRRGFDVLHLEHLWSGWLGWDVPERSIVNVHYLFDLDLRQPATRSAVENARRRSWLRAERKLLNRFPHISALTDTLAQRIRQIAPAANVMTTPLGF